MLQQQLLDIYHSNMKLSVKLLAVLAVLPQLLCWYIPVSDSLLYWLLLLRQLGQCSHFLCWLTASLAPSHRQAATTLHSPIRDLADPRTLATGVWVATHRHQTHSHSHTGLYNFLLEETREQTLISLGCADNVDYRSHWDVFGDVGCENEVFKV